MQLDAVEHFKNIVLPAIAHYRDAEHGLSRAIVEKNEEAAERARYAALRLGGSAVIYLHHFADVIAHRPPDGMPDFKGRIRDLRKWLTSRDKNANEHFTLLADVADALKHAVLTRNLPRQVEHRGQVLAINRKYGTGRYGEGKLNGIEEVWVFAKSGKRPLAKVLMPVADMWKTVLRELEIGGSYTS